MNFKRFGRTAQLFDYQKMASGTTGKYLNDSGEEIVSSIWGITGYIPCDGMNFTVASLGGNAPSICLYDGNKTFIAGQAYNTGGGGTKTTITISSETQAKYIRFSYLNDTATSPDDLSAIMLNEGSTVLPYQPYKDWHDTPHYIHKTDTDILTTLPAEIYANDTTATVGLKGNMEQSGTPTPDNPIMPEGTGDRTENLCEIDGFISGATEQKLLQTVVLNAGTYTYSCTQNDTLSSNARNCLMIRIGQAAYTYESTQQNYHLSAGKHTMTFTVTNDNTSVELRYWINTFSNACSFDDFMLNTGSTALPYEPYGYKIPILSAGQTTPVYLGEVETTRKIIKYEFTGEENWIRESGNTYALERVKQTATGYENALCTHYVLAKSYSTLTGTDGTFSVSKRPALFIHDENFTTAAQLKTYLATQYANGTPVVIYYTLNTPETAVVNEPLRKIGDYADEVSGISIPTTAGANTLSVDTTLQPSEVSVNYKGWHPVADVHEAENGQWD